MEFIDFRRLLRSRRIDLVFPGWEEGERVAFLSPHDDDVILGAGYLLLSTVEARGVPHVFIFTTGDAGYSVPEDKEKIVSMRKKEALSAYIKMGVRKDNIHFLGLTDFSLMPYVNRKIPGGEGIFEEIVQTFRENKVSRVVFSNGYFENWDHTAVFNIGMYVVPQAGDAVLSDLGKPHPLRTYVLYSVWGDFEPQYAESHMIRADLGIMAGQKEEDKVLEAINAFTSQKEIISTILKERKKRKRKARFLELYKAPCVRKQIEFTPYFEIIPRCKKV
ncbi:MAG: PIG-L deacetylase family protein [Candidatus Aminicenantales bacterium]